MSQKLSDWRERFEAYDRAQDKRRKKEAQENRERASQEMPEVLYDPVIRTALLSYVSDKELKSIVKMYSSFVCEFFECDHCVVNQGWYIPFREGEMMKKHRLSIFKPSVQPGEFVQLRDSKGHPVLIFRITEKKIFLALFKRDSQVMIWHDQKCSTQKKLQYYDMQAKMISARFKLFIAGRTISDMTLDFLLGAIKSSSLQIDFASGESETFHYLRAVKGGNDQFLRDYITQQMRKHNGKIDLARKYRRGYYDSVA